jgi:hypothetical protein
MDFDFPSPVVDQQNQDAKHKEELDDFLMKNRVQ